jgi:hypothetical protein
MKNFFWVIYHLSASKSVNHFLFEERRWSRLSPASKQLKGYSESSSSNLISATGLPDFSRYKHTKTGKNKPNDHI